MWTKELKLKALKRAINTPSFLLHRGPHECGTYTEASVVGDAAGAGVAAPW